MSRLTCSISVISRPPLALVVERRAVAGDPADVVDVGDGADLAHDLLDVPQARGLESEPAQSRPVLDGIHPRREDAHPGVGDGRGYVLEKVHPVQRLDEQLHRKEPSPALRPLDLDKTLRVARLQGAGVRASGRVHHDPTTQRDVTYDVVTGHRAAAAGEAREYAARPDHPHSRLRVG